MPSYWKICKIDTFKGTYLRLNLKISLLLFRHIVLVQLQHIFIDLMRNVYNDVNKLLLKYRFNMFTRNFQNALFDIETVPEYILIPILRDFSQSISFCIILRRLNLWCCGTISSKSLIFYKPIKIYVLNKLWLTSIFTDRPILIWVSRENIFNGFGCQ